jgi:hypothetical protein
MSISANGGAISLTLDPSSLAYSVALSGDPWFDSKGADGGYAFSAEGTVSLSDKTLKPIGEPKAGNGIDATGAFSSLSISFARAASAGTDAEWVATFKAYENRSALVFGQRWIKGSSVAKGGSTFPSLHQVNAKSQLGTLEYTGASCGFMVGAQGEFPGITGGSSKGYIVISPQDTTGTGAPATLVIGPVTEHFADQARNEENSLVYGMAPTFESVPAGYEIETVLVASVRSNGKSHKSRKSKLDARESKAAQAQPERASIASGGVNAALMEFGDFLLARHNKTRTRGDHKPETAYIGYSTTGYYFYNLCDCLDKPVPTAVSGGKPDPRNRQTCVNSPIPARFLQEAATPGVCTSYADTLIAVNAALKEQGIAIKHFLLDR